jgi:excisionase family DNA binding protein
MGDDAAAGGERDWLSVREAARYLQISEPTLFRWMRDGDVSFYKVGRGTRFKREALDAVVHKRTGRSEADAAALRCACCGNAEMIEGHLQGTGRMYFRPLKTRFWVLREAMVPTRARTCTACGHVQLFADPEKLGALLPEPT